MTYELITAEWDAKIEAATVACMNGDATEDDVESVMADAAEAICAFLDGQI
jgi:hypothetical protein